MQAINYLQFGGNADEAIRFYEKVLQATTTKKVKFGVLEDNPAAPMKEEEKKMIMESSLEFLGNKIMISDIPPFMQKTIGDLSIGNTLIVSLIDGEPEIYQQYFKGLSLEGKVIMPLTEVPWSSCFGIVMDKFGVIWKLNSDASQFLSSFEEKSK